MDNPGTYSWEDKFRPRKPRFFNRVHTGFEWNKYNQTHYEYVWLSQRSRPWLTLLSSAPTTLLQRLFRVTNSTSSTRILCKCSKTVLQFARLRTDSYSNCRSDKTKTPSYKFVRTKDDPDTCLLVFTAGPPYEDIAFRIVDKEWEYSHKRLVSDYFINPCLRLMRRLLYRSLSQQRLQEFVRPRSVTAVLQLQATILQVSGLSRYRHPKRSVLTWAILEITESKAVLFERAGRFASCVLETSRGGLLLYNCSVTRRICVMLLAFSRLHYQAHKHDSCAVGGDTGLNCCKRELV